MQLPANTNLRAKRFIQVVLRFLLVVCCGLAGSAAAAMACFLACYLICRLIVWMTGNSNHMNVMWFLLPVEVIAFIVGFIAGVTLCGSLLLRKKLILPPSEVKRGRK